MTTAAAKARRAYSCSPLDADAGVQYVLSWVAGVADQLDRHFHGSNASPKLLPYLVHFIAGFPHRFGVADALGGPIGRILHSRHDVRRDGACRAHMVIVRSLGVRVNAARRVQAGRWLDANLAARHNSTNP